MEIRVQCGQTWCLNKCWSVKYSGGKFHSHVTMLASDFSFGSFFFSNVWVKANMSVAIKRKEIGSVT